jgi:acyl-CoA synthetase (AMP-forming)/AMP-acid ligase II
VSHFNLAANALQTASIRNAFIQYGPEGPPEHRWIGFLPLYHAYGQNYIIQLATKLQVPTYVMKKFVLEDFLRHIQTYKITYLHVVPPIMVMLSKRPEVAKYDLSSVNEIGCGAAPLSRELQNEVSRKFGVSVKQGWGMTEVTTGAMHVPGGMPDEYVDICFCRNASTTTNEPHSRTGSVGVLDPNCECRLLDDNGNEVQDGEPGELYVRGPNVTLGYWKNEEATRETMLPGGWLRSGDIAICRGDWFWIVDRKKVGSLCSTSALSLAAAPLLTIANQELIKVNGLQVAPAELEAALLENDDVADAAVVGVTV